MLPLTNLRVVDLGTVMMSPYASQWLGDLGADVIKVETLDGDSTRTTGPTNESGMSALYLGLNRNKRSLALDLRSSAGREVFDRLLGSADVLMHNIRPQKLAKLGLEPEAVLSRHPRLIYALLLGFGSAGSYHGQPAYDDIIQGLSGTVDLVRRQGNEPRYLPTLYADKICGMTAALGIVAAVHARASSGKGAVVEVPMFETMTAFNLVEHFYGAHFSPPQGEMGYDRALSAMRGPYRTADGYLSVMPYTDKHWEVLFQHLGEGALGSDPRFKSMGDRTRNIRALHTALGELMRHRKSSDWLDLLEKIGIPVAKVNSLEDLERDPHLVSAGFFEALEDPEMGTIKFPGVPLSFDGQRPPIAMPPRHGQHNSAILEELGFTPAQVSELVAEGSVRVAAA